MRDATSGFRAYRSAGLASLVTAGSEANGYGFQIESTWRASRAGSTVLEVPIEFIERRPGHSKMSPTIEALWRVLRWRLASGGSPTVPSDSEDIVPPAPTGASA